MNSLLPIIFIAVMMLAFYFLVLRPAKRRQTEAVAVQSQLAPGLQIMTTAGIYGTVAAVDDDTVIIEIAPGVPVKYAKAAVAQIVSPAVDGSHDELPVAGDQQADDTTEPTTDANEGGR